MISNRVYNHFGDENEKVKDVISFFFDKLKDVIYFTIIVNILDNNSTCDKLSYFIDKHLKFRTDISCCHLLL